MRDMVQDFISGGAVNVICHSLGMEFVFGLRKWS
jgi:hypothetical protein